LNKVVLKRQLEFKHLSIFLGVFAALINASIVCAQDQAAAPLAQKKTNVLFIVVDDLNNDLGTYGNQTVKSPNVDRLAKLGTRFERAYCQLPWCNPSRTSFLSGLRPDTTGVINNRVSPRANLKDWIFLPQYFKRNGYFTARSGKIYHDGQDDAASWDVSEPGWGEVQEPLREFDAQDPILSRQGVFRAQTGWDLFWRELNVADEKLGDAEVARRISAMIEEQTRAGKPFFLAAGFRRPHQPWDAPKKYYDLYRNASITWMQEPAADVLKNIPATAIKEPTTFAPLSDADRREAIRAYYASVSFMDAQLGKILDQMDKLNLWDRTIVVFFSDHGFMLGEHGGFWQKEVLFEQATRVPLVVVAPGKQKNRSSVQFIELIDLYPTLVELAGLPAKAGLEGTSFAPQLNSSNISGKMAAHTIAGRTSPERIGRSVRTERWRYNEWGSLQFAELYDHERDPGEYHNLAKDPKYKLIVDEMRRLLQDKTPLPKAPRANERDWRGMPAKQ
jgi:uncharacterized sulfatase